MRLTTRACLSAGAQDGLLKRGTLSIFEVLQPSSGMITVDRTAGWSVMGVDRPGPPGRLQNFCRDSMSSACSALLLRILLVRTLAKLNSAKWDSKLENE